MSKTNLISQAHLREQFDYADGHLLWRVSKPRIRKGDVAGCLSQDGRVKICVFGRLYLAHRLIWIWHHGDLHGQEIDHKNRIPSDNRIENLRLATRSENNANKTAKRNNTSGYKGVFFHKKARKWTASISFNRKAHYLGLFETKELAYECYALAAEMLHGSFANT